jgi:hypothetical protein
MYARASHATSISEFNSSMLRVTSGLQRHRTGSYKKNRSVDPAGINVSNGEISTRRTASSIDSIVQRVSSCQHIGLGLRGELQRTVTPVTSYAPLRRVFARL